MWNGIAALTRVIDLVNTRVGQAASWLYMVLMLVIVFNVVMRYGFSFGSIMLEEIQWHLYSFAFLLGLAYTLADDAHVRVDVVYGGLSPRKKAWIDLFGCLFLLLPMAGFLAWYAWPYAVTSWEYGERSDMPSGLPARYVIKFVMFVGFTMLFVQGLSMTAQKIMLLVGSRRA
jgi:TRAP-type mannitol/chloroaromatic compound transport system permease small subunit